VVRFDDNGRYLAEFSDRIVVRCPKCQSKAIVIAPREEVQARVVCSSCPYAADLDDTGWLGPLRGSVRRRCAMCGCWVERRFRGPRPSRVVQCACDCGWQFESALMIGDLSSSGTRLDELNKRAW
jgi:hypothetical protein